MAAAVVVGAVSVLAGMGASMAASPGPVTLRATFASFPDYMDPQLSYTAEGWDAMHDTYIPLLTYRSANGKAGADVIPGLAKGMPKVSDGGQLLPTKQILPWGMPGYRKFDLYPYNLRKARRLIANARPSDRNITVWTDTEAPNEEAGEYYAGVLHQIGFHIHLKKISALDYFTVIGNRRTPNLDTGWSDWFEDFPHPDDFFQPLLLGSSILPTNNGNFAQIDVPSLNAKIEELDRKTLGPSTERAYAALDRSYMKLAPWAPYGTRVLSIFVAKRVDLGKVVWNPTFGADIATFQFK